jgi:hypothetical protein
VRTVAHLLRLHYFCIPTFSRFSFLFRTRFTCERHSGQTTCGLLHTWRLIIIRFVCTQFTCELAQARPRADCCTPAACLLSYVYYVVSTFRTKFTCERGCYFIFLVSGRYFCTRGDVLGYLTYFLFRNSGGSPLTLLSYSIRILCIIVVVKTILCIIVVFIIMLIIIIIYIVYFLVLLLSLLPYLLSRSPSACTWPTLSSLLLVLLIF